MRTVVPCTLPLALYGQREYAAVMGCLAHSAAGQAITFVACGYIAVWLELVPLLYAMLVVATINLGLSIFVFG